MGGVKKQILRPDFNGTQNDIFRSAPALSGAFSSESNSDATKDNLSLAFGEARLKGGQPSPKRGGSIAPSPVRGGFALRIHPEGKGRG